MSRYIEADKVLKELRLNHNDVIYIDKRDTAKRIEMIQGIDIVRCKECKYGSDNKVYGCMCDHFNDNDYSYHRMYADDYCSYGEREGE